MIDGINSFLDGLHNDHDAAVAAIDAEMERLQARYLDLQYLRNVLVPPVDDSEETAEQAYVPEVKATTKPQAAALYTGTEQYIFEVVAAQGRMSVKDLSELTGQHPTKIGRIVGKSSRLAKDGKFVVLA